MLFRKALLFLVSVLACTTTLSAMAQNQSSLSDSVSQILPQIDTSKLSKDFVSGYLNQIVQSIAKDASIYDLVGFSIGMVVYGIFIFHFYRFLAKKDMFSFNLEQRLQGGKLKTDGKKISVAPRVVAYIATNVFIFPIVVFLWFLVYSLFMFFLAQHLSVKEVFLVSSSLIIAVRIAAYYNEDLSRDLAKLLPFALLGIFLISPTFFALDTVKSRLVEIPHFVVQIAAFLIVAMAVETTLSILYLFKLKFVGHKKKKDKVNDSEHPI